VDHEIHEVEQDPPAAGEPFHVVGVVTAAAQLLDDRFGDAADVRVRGTGSDDEIVGSVGQSTQIEYHELIALQVLDGVQGQAERLGRRRHRPFLSPIKAHPFAPAAAPSGWAGEPSST
jgi:hypothetical protein